MIQFFAPLTRLNERLFERISPHAGVINTFNLISEVGNDLIKSLFIGFPACKKTLWRDLISVAAPGRDECSEVHILLPLIGNHSKL